MQIEITPDLRGKYLESIFGSLIIRNVPNRKSHEKLEERKRELESEIREYLEEVNTDSMIQYYNAYFKKWGKIYPIKYQIDTIKSGRKFPQVSVLVDSMFLAELHNRLLTSGHDLDEIQGDLAFDVSKGGERYLKLNGQEQELKKNDVIIKDDEGILASNIYGPARKTSITLRTKNALNFAWCPYALDEEIISTHLNEILTNLTHIFNSVTPKSRLIRP